MSNGLSDFVDRARYIIKTDGVIGLIKRSYLYFLPSVFSHHHVYLYEHGLEDWAEENFLSRLPNVVCKIVQSNEEADQIAKTYVDFREQFFKARDNLNKGAVAVCLYVGSNLAHISFLALSPQAKTACDAIPYTVNFSDRQACTGSTFTDPTYRGQNLMTYGCYKKFQYLRQRGITSVRHAIDINNAASQKVYRKFNFTVYARARYLKILMFKYWRVTPMA